VIVWEDMTPAHFVEWGVEFFPHPSRLLGFACRRDGYLVAIGFVLVDEDETWWASFAKRGDYPRAGIHRYALSLFAAMDRAGIPEIFATADPKIDRSAEWLERLGFTPTESEVWKRELRCGHDRRRREAQSFADAGQGGSGAGRLGADGSECGSRPT